MEVPLAVVDVLSDAFGMGVVAGELCGEISE